MTGRVRQNVVFVVYIHYYYPIYVCYWEHPNHYVVLLHPSVSLLGERGENWWPIYITLENLSLLIDIFNFFLAYCFVTLTWKSNVKFAVANSYVVSFASTLLQLSLLNELFAQPSLVYLMFTFIFDSTNPISALTKLAVWTLQHCCSFCVNYLMSIFLLSIPRSNSGPVASPVFHLGLA